MEKNFNLKEFKKIYLILEKFKNKKKMGKYLPQYGSCFEWVSRAGFPDSADYNLSGIHIFFIKWP